MSDSHREGQALKIPECGALGEVLDGMLQSPEDDSLGPGEHQRDHPGRQHHPPEQKEKLASDLFIFGTYIALVLCFETSRDERGCAILMYLKEC